MCVKHGLMNQLHIDKYENDPSWKDCGSAGRPGCPLIAGPVVQYLAPFNHISQ